MMEQFIVGVESSKPFNVERTRYRRDLRMQCDSTHRESSIRD